MSFLIIILLSGCNAIESASSNNTTNNVQPSPKTSPTVGRNFNQATNTAPNLEEGSEITGWSPEKLYQGEILTVSMRTPHGGYAAIKRVKDSRWFFLYGVEKSALVWDVSVFSKIAEVKINVSTAVNTTNAGADGEPEKIFNQTGKYQIMISNEDFGQDDPIWTGICEVEYVNEKRPKS